MHDYKLKGILMQLPHWIGRLPIQIYNREEGSYRQVTDPMMIAQALVIFQWLHPLQVIR